jgi:hypothetical protein
MNQKQEIESVSFSLDDDHILSATTNNEVVLRCTDYTDDECSDVVVYVTRKLYHQIIDTWLDRKQNYYEMYNGSFCGVGSISITNLKELDDQCNLLHWVKDDTEEEFGERAEYRNVRTFEGFAFDVDMEHG